MKLTAEQCFADEEGNLLAWSEGLTEADQERLRDHLRHVTGPERTHYRLLTLDAGRVALSRTLVSPVSRTQAGHALIFSRADNGYGFLPVCHHPDAFMALCPYTGATAPVRAMEVEDPDPAALLPRLARVGSWSQLSMLIEAAVLATEDHPWTFVPQHPSQVVPWFHALMACVPSAWRASVSWATSETELPCAWRGGRGGAPVDGTVWRFGTPTKPSRLVYATTLAERILQNRIEDAVAQVAQIKGIRPDDPRAAADMLDWHVKRSAEEGAEQALYEAARWTRQELGAILAPAAAPSAPAKPAKNWSSSSDATIRLSDDTPTALL